MWDWEKTAMVGLESSSMPYTGRSIARWHIDKSSKRYNKRERYRKRYEENI